MDGVGVAREVGELLVAEGADPVFDGAEELGDAAFEGVRFVDAEPFARAFTRVFVVPGGAPTNSGR